MNKKIKLSAKLAILSIITLFSVFAGASNASAQYAVPTCNSATLNGNIVTNGATTNVWFEWGPNGSIIYSTPTQTFFSDSNYSQVISGLQENSVYSYRAMASNSNGTSTGSIISFTTPACSQPVIPPTQTATPTATISTTPSCTAPCNVQVSWTSSNVATTTRFYKNGVYIWNQAANMPGSETDWGVAQGTYRYCIRAVNADWVTETGDLACSTTTVNAAAIIPPPAAAASPTASISSTPSCTAPCNVQVSWTSANVTTTLKIYKNGIYLFNQAANISGTQTDWGVPQGTYQYCVRAVNPDWFSETGNLNCSTTTVSAAAIIPPPASTMSGTLTPATFSCIIFAGQNSCNINFSWNTINPVATSAVTSITGGTLATGNSGSSSFAIPFGSKTFFLYNNAVLLDQKTVSASCASGTVWNGNACQTNTSQQTCQDSTATNFGGAAPCTYAPQVCQDAASLNFHGTLPCRYSQTSNPSVSNNTNTNPIVNNNTSSNPIVSNNTNNNPSVNNNTNNNTNNNNPVINVNVNGGGGNSVQTCQDGNANNFGGTLPCRYNNYINPINPAPIYNYPISNPISNYSLTATTTPATQITDNSAQLNGLILNSSTNIPANAWFEWGTTPNLGNVTPTTSIGTTPAFRHASIITGLLPGTIYYYRVEAENYSTRNVGTILNFVTSSFQNINTFTNQIPVTTTVVRNTTVVNRSGGRPSLVLLTIDGGSDTISSNETRNYHVTWRNQSNQTLTKVILRVLLPASMDFVNATKGLFTKSDNTLTYEIGTLVPGESGDLFMTAVTNSTLKENELVVVIANLVYTDATNTQGDALAYATHHAASLFNLGANVFGSGEFLPNSLFGWLLLLILILILVFLSRFTYSEFKK